MPHKRIDHASGHALVGAGSVVRLRHVGLRLRGVHGGGHIGGARGRNVSRSRRRGALIEVNGERAHQIPGGGQLVVDTSLVDADRGNAGNANAPVATSINEGANVVVASVVIAKVVVATVVATDVAESIGLAALLALLHALQTNDDSAVVLVAHGAGGGVKGRNGGPDILQRGNADGASLEEARTAAKT